MAPRAHAGMSPARADRLTLRGHLAGGSGGEFTHIELRSKNVAEQHEQNRAIRPVAVDLDEPVGHRRSLARAAS